MNYMEQIAKMLGVSLNEEFYVTKLDEETLELTGLENGKFKFQKYGLVDGEGLIRDNVLARLICGDYKIKRAPWKPKHGEKFYRVDNEGEHDFYYWAGHTTDVMLYKIGNCFKTKEEITPEIIKKYTNFFKDDERMIDI